MLHHESQESAEAFLARPGAGEHVDRFSTISRSWVTATQREAAHIEEVSPGQLLRPENADVPFVELEDDPPGTVPARVRQLDAKAAGVPIAQAPVEVLVHRPHGAPELYRRSITLRRGDDTVVRVSYTPVKPGGPIVIFS
jgi:hypothetical protein